MNTTNTNYDYLLHVRHFDRRATKWPSSGEIRYTKQIFCTVTGYLDFAALRSPLGTPYGGDDPGKRSY
ncbi:MAG: hypothetical protein ACYSTT_03685 [Planctomycetota bacterium]